MNIAIVLAGGKGTRMGATSEPKQFTEVNDKPIIIHTLESFETHEDIQAIAVVCLKEWKDNIKELIEMYELKKVMWIAEGGPTRQESVRNGLKAISSEVQGEDIVLIHDGARPLVSHKIITDNIAKAKEFGAVNTVIAATDTIVQSKDGNVITEVPVRKELFMAQTPQSFKFQVISQAHDFAVKNSVEDATDDCQLVFRLSGQVYLVQGDKLNLKITTKEDLAILEALIKMRSS